MDKAGPRKAGPKKSGAKGGKRGLCEKMRKPGSKGAPTAAALKRSQGPR